MRTISRKATKCWHSSIVSLLSFKAPAPWIISNSTRSTTSSPGRSSRVMPIHSRLKAANLTSLLSHDLPRTLEAPDARQSGTPMRWVTLRLILTSWVVEMQTGKLWLTRPCSGLTSTSHLTSLWALLCLRKLTQTKLAKLVRWSPIELARTPKDSRTQKLAKTTLSAKETCTRWKSCAAKRPKE